MSGSSVLKAENPSSSWFFQNDQTNFFSSGFDSFSYISRQLVSWLISKSINKRHSPITKDNLTPASDGLRSSNLLFFPLSLIPHSALNFSFRSVSSNSYSRLQFSFGYWQTHSLTGFRFSLLCLFWLLHGHCQMALRGARTTSFYVHFNFEMFSSWFEPLHLIQFQRLSLPHLTGKNTSNPQIKFRVLID